MHRDADKVSRRVADVLKDVASLEILQAPGLTFKIPDLFASIPRLTGSPTPWPLPLLLLCHLSLPATNLTPAATAAKLGDLP